MNEYSNSKEKGFCQHGNNPISCEACKLEGLTEYNGFLVHRFPERIVRGFAEGKIAETAIRKREVENLTLYALMISPDEAVGIPGAQLISFYSKRKPEYIAIAPNAFDEQLHFQYGVTDESGTSHSIAEMQFADRGNNYFDLHHRYVAPNFRKRSGLGSKLLAQSEQWFQQLANESNKDIMLSADAGQVSVMKWLVKAGYSPIVNDRTKYEDIVAHPEKYVSAQLSDYDHKDEYLFPKDAKIREHKDVIRITFEKTIKPIKEKTA